MSAFMIKVEDNKASISQPSATIVRPTPQEVIDLTTPSPQASEDEAYIPRTSAASRRAKKRETPQTSSHPSSAPISSNHTDFTASRRRTKSARRPKAFLPNSPSSESTLDPEERLVYVLKVERKKNVGTKYIALLHKPIWEPGDLDNVVIYGIFQSLHDANMAVRDKFEDLCEETGLSVEDNSIEYDVGKSGDMVSLEIYDPDTRESWTVRLQECVLR